MNSQTGVAHLYRNVHELESAVQYFLEAQKAHSNITMSIVSKGENLEGQVCIYGLPVPQFD